VKITPLVSFPHDKGVVMMTFYFRYLASAPKVHWQAGAEAPALEQEPKLKSLQSTLLRQTTSRKNLPQIRIACGILSA
jgi:hypothetical protein